MRNSFVLYTDLGKQMDRLTDAEAGSVIKAVFAYVQTGVLPEKLRPKADMVFSFIQERMDRDGEKYDRIRAQRAEAGRKGGLATRSKAEAMAANAGQTAAAEAVSVSVSVSDSVSVPVSESVSVSGSVSEPVSSPAPRLYGKYHNIFLTPEEYRQLQQEFPTDYRQRLERLSEYSASSGKKYQNALATIRAWAKKDREEHHGIHTETDQITEVGRRLGTVV